MTKSKEDTKNWLVASTEGDWYTGPVPADTAVDAVLVNVLVTEENLEEGNRYSVWELASKDPVILEAQVALQPSK